MVNIKMWRHPKYYKDLRKLARLRNRDEAISDSAATADRERAPRTGQSGKQQAASTHPDLLPNHGPEYYAPRRRKRQATSTSKRQATSGKRQASE
jgi:hypothetical protein